MKITVFNPETKNIGGTLTDAEFKIIDEVFKKTNPEDGMEIELLDKKGFIEEKKVRDTIDKAGGYKGGDWPSIREAIKKELGLMPK